MPIIHKRICDFCGNYYEGTGDKYCSRECGYKQKTGHERKKQSPIIRFFSKVDKMSHPCGCWIFNGTISREGYGRFRLGNKLMSAHRAAWILTHGSVPSNLLICHSCDNRRCVNPKHLFIGTAKDNVIDKITKHREYYLRGEQLPQTKLNSSDVLLIKSLLLNNIKQNVIAQYFNITQSVISRIKNNKTWRHIT